MGDTQFDVYSYRECQYICAISSKVRGAPQNSGVATRRLNKRVHAW